MPLRTRLRRRTCRRRCPACAGRCSIRRLRLGLRVRRRRCPACAGWSGIGRPRPGPQARRRRCPARADSSCIDRFRRDPEARRRRCPACARRCGSAYFVAVLEAVAVGVRLARVGVVAIDLGAVVHAVAVGVSLARVGVEAADLGRVAQAVSVGVRSGGNGGRLLAIGRSASARGRGRHAGQQDKGGQRSSEPKSHSFIVVAVGDRFRVGPAVSVLTTSVRSRESAQTTGDVDAGASGLEAPPSKDLVAGKKTGP